MKLHAQARYGAADEGPWLVWLHGFLGSLAEWQPVAASLAHFSHLFVDLPGHGGSAPLQAQNFAQVNAWLAETLNSYNIRNHWLIGYSLGGRVAINFACQQRKSGLLGLIVEGAHPGLRLVCERQARLAADRRWAQRFRQAPLHEVLAQWYRQPVFASLSESERVALVALRSRNHPQALAAMLEATSLGHQPDLRAPLSELQRPFHFLCGEKDLKFAALAAELAAPRHLITAAGHNAHRENPQAVARCIAEILHHSSSVNTRILHDLP